MMFLTEILVWFQKIFVRFFLKLFHARELCFRLILSSQYVKIFYNSLLIDQDVQNEIKGQLKFFLKHSIESIILKYWTMRRHDFPAYLISVAILKTKLKMAAICAVCKAQK